MLLIDVLHPRPTFTLSVLYGIAPLIACAVLSPAWTALLAATATVLAAASGIWNQTWGTAQQAVRIVDVLLVGVAAVAVATVRVRRERQVARLVAIADTAQRAILPIVPAQAGPVRVAARYVSAARDAVVGGDLYDCYRYTSSASKDPERVRFIVGDVRGKGIAGVEQAARVIRAFRQSAALEPTLPLVAEAMDSYLAGFFEAEEFVTALLVDVSDPSGIVLVSCGHPPALLRRSDGSLALLEAPPGLPLGMGLPDRQPYRDLTVPWAPGDRLLLYTDGLSEARDRDGQFLSPLALGPALSGPEVLKAMDAVLEAVGRHTPGARLADDLALLLLEYAAPDGESTPEPRDVLRPREPTVPDTSSPPVAGSPADHPPGLDAPLSHTGEGRAELGSARLGADSTVHGAAS
ncbi:PP2C family protein-serine/threonine phosphatase [Terrabacter sp. BE26]|uniref:PP2C family protein-serine/threonine phosphatase n=1 Tax=Terrabacter sp. BE26 TaxID=2898152 RepID=UPI0035BE31C0